MGIIIIGNTTGTVMIKLFTKVTHGRTYVSHGLASSRYSIRVQSHFLNHRDSDIMPVVLHKLNILT